MGMWFSWALLEALVLLLLKVLPQEFSSSSRANPWVVVPHPSMTTQLRMFVGTPEVLDQGCFSCSCEGFGLFTAWRDFAGFTVIYSSCFVMFVSLFQ